MLLPHDALISDGWHLVLVADEGLMLEAPYVGSGAMLPWGDIRVRQRGGQGKRSDACVTHMFMYEGCQYVDTSL